MAGDVHEVAVSQELGRLAGALGRQADADVILFSGSLEGDVDERLAVAVRQRRRCANVVLILNTDGGKADHAYRIARALQRSYSRFTVLIAGRCKSAGTLLAVGANDLVMADPGELGPLDVQLQKPDELWEMSSGMIATDALTTLGSQAFELWESMFIEVRRRSGMQISTRRSSSWIRCAWRRTRAGCAWRWSTATA